MNSAGKLFLVPTPIGNLEDFSPHAAKVLAEVDCIAAEDTRVAADLLAALSLPFKELISYHEHNEQSRQEQLISALLDGQNIALVSDAGMPAISDPGEILVKAARKAGLEVIALPGPNAAITALSASGLSTRYFYFEGFLPVKGPERKERLAFLQNFPHSMIIYEAPHRLAKTLKDLIQYLGAERLICLARELTKKYETYLLLSLNEALAEIKREKARGEYVLILEGQKEFLERIPAVKAECEAAELNNLREDISSLKAEGLSDRTCLQILQKFYPLGKNKIYELLRDFAD